MIIISISPHTTERRAKVVTDITIVIKMVVNPDAVVLLLGLHGSNLSDSAEVTLYKIILLMMK